MFLSIQQVYTPMYSRRDNDFAELSYFLVSVDLRKQITSSLMSSVAVGYEDRSKAKRVIGHVNRCAMFELEWVSG